MKGLSMANTPRRRKNASHAARDGGSASQPGFLSTRVRRGGLGAQSAASAAMPSSSALPAAPVMPLLLLILLLLALVPAPVSGVFFALQNITDQAAKYCGFYELRRYTAWCQNANITAFVASNSTCQVYGVCIPLEGAENMTCTNKTYCNYIRTDIGSKNYNKVSACLVVRAAVNGTEAQCDFSIEGSSTYDAPPPMPNPPPAPPPPKSPKHHNWKTWKTLTLIFSIVGGIGVIVGVVLLIRWLMLRRKRSSTPVTVLSEKGKQQLEEEQARQQAGGQQPPPLGGAPGAPHAMLSPGAAVTIRPTAPDGRPILGYGSVHPPGSPLDTAVTTSAGGRLAPGAGDALLNAGASSRAAYNGPPLRSAPATVPSLMGAPALGPPPPPPVTPGAPPIGAVGGPGEPPPAVLPAALLPPTAASLQNPTAAS